MRKSVVHFLATTALCTLFICLFLVRTLVDDTRATATLPDHRNLSSLLSGRVVALPSTDGPAAKPAGKISPPKEADSTLREWNAPYHKKRAELHRQQSTTGVGPLAAHYVWANDCTHHFAWQSMALERSLEAQGALRHGFVSRLVSMCRSMPSNRPMHLQSVFRDEESDARHGVFFTPHERLAGRDFTLNTRPLTISFWLRHSDVSEPAVVLLDADMLLIKPIFTPPIPAAPSPPSEQVRSSNSVDQIGRVAASDAAAGTITAQYQKALDRPENRAILTKASAVRQRLQGNASTRESRETRKSTNATTLSPLSAGPPVVLSQLNLRRLLPVWIALVPEVARHGGPSVEWIEDPVAFSLAADYLHMAVDVRPDLAAEKAAQPGLWTQAPLFSNTSKQKRITVDQLLPTHTAAVLHYSGFWEGGEETPKGGLAAEAQHQRLVEHERNVMEPAMGYYHFSKYRVEDSVLQCSRPLLFQSFERTPLSLRKEEWRRDLAMIRQTVPLLNDMLVAYKTKYCAASSTGSTTERERKTLQPRLRTTHQGSFVSDFVVESVSVDGAMRYRRHDSDQWQVSEQHVRTVATTKKKLNATSP